MSRCRNRLERISARNRACARPHAEGDAKQQRDEEQASRTDHCPLRVLSFARLYRADGAHCGRVVTRKERQDETRLAERSRETTFREDDAGRPHRSVPLRRVARLCAAAQGRPWSFGSETEFPIGQNGCLCQTCQRRRRRRPPFSDLTGRWPGWSQGPSPIGVPLARVRPNLAPLLGSAAREVQRLRRRRPVPIVERGARSPFSTVKRWVDMYSRMCSVDPG